MKESARSPMYSAEILEELLSRLEDEVTADGQYRVFDGKNDGEADSVKFIIETAAIG